MIDYGVYSHSRASARRKKSAFSPRGAIYNDNDALDSWNFIDRRLHQRQWRSACDKFLGTTFTSLVYDPS